MWSTVFFIFTLGFLTSTPSLGAGSVILEDFIKNTHSQNCESRLIDFEKEIPNSFEKRFYTQNEARPLIHTSMQERILLRKGLLGLSPLCDQVLRRIFIEQRDREDYLALYSELQTQVDSNSISFDQQPVPLKERSPIYEDYVTLSGPRKNAFQFESGDIMITRGVSWFSSTIAHSSSNQNHFSHGVLIYKDSAQAEHTIESYIGSGVSLYPMNQALKNENARIQVYRLKDDTVLAHEAASLAHQKFIIDRKVGYDYDSDFSTDEKLTCVEIPFWAYKLASQNQITLPEKPSWMTATDNNLLERLGLKTGLTFSPSDIELDSRFELLAEWTDFRLTRTNLLKDIVSEKLMKWTTDLGYQYKPTWLSDLLKSDVIKAILGFFHVIPADLPKAYAIASTRIIAASDQIYDLLNREYEQMVLDAKTQLSGHHPPTKRELLDRLEEIREQDFLRFKRKETPLLIHNTLRISYPH